jgi:hypothetical protein
MKSITTKYLSPGNVRGARMKASDHDGNEATVPYDYGSNDDARHAKACEALMRKMKWDGHYVGGWSGPGQMTWVCVDKGAPHLVAEKHDGGEITFTLSA